jgi:acetyl esterase/lipase
MIGPSHGGHGDDRPRRGIVLAAALAGMLALSACGARVPHPPPVQKPAGHFPAYVQIGRAAGRPVGAIILIHGGGFVETGPATMASLVPLAQRFNAAGWETFNIDYHPLARSRRDVVSAYDTVRARVGPSVPICAMGASAGGALALLLAVERPSLACVMSWAGPTDLAPLMTPRNPVFGDLQRLAASIHQRLAAWSPVKLAARLRSPTFLLYAANDPIVPPAQGAALHAKVPRSTFIVMPPGVAGFVHSGVDGTAFHRALTVEDRMLQSVAAHGG